jgi:hypothetical protein
MSAGGDSDTDRRSRRNARCTLQVYLAETTAPYVAYIKEDAVTKFEARYPDVKIA